jgi:glycerophosphoryl diester phosphodiesterase
VTHPLLDPGSRIVIAHRGNRARTSENTIESLREAQLLGADALEFDVRVTRDGVPVVIHDPDVDRTTNGTGLVRSFTFQQLRTLDASIGASTASTTPERVPALEEVLEALPRVPLVIEVKEVAAVEPTERLIRRFNAVDRVIVGSAENAVMEMFYDSVLSTCASMRDAVRLIPRALAGLRPATPRYDVLSVTQRFRGIPIPVIRMAAAARKIGIATQVWTVNDPMAAQRLWNGGIAGVVTDDPAAMLRIRPQ